MKALLALSRGIDALNERVGKLAYWLVLAAVLVSAGNAGIRYAFNMSSNAWLEIQWYLFSAVFLLCSGYALLHNQHVRIDIISGRLSRRAQAWIDILGTIFFLMPMALLILWLSWPVFVDAYTHNEVSTNAGGLIVWPARLLLPAIELYRARFQPSAVLAQPYVMIGVPVVAAGRCQVPVSFQRT